MLCKLEPVVESDGFYVVIHGFFPYFIDYVDSIFPVDIVDNSQVAGFSIDESDEILFVFAKHHQISLKMPILQALII